MSLRDELLKAGLVSKEKAEQTEKQVRKQAHRVKKDKGLAAAEGACQREQQRQREAEATRQREQDRALNLAREAEKQRRAVLAQAQQLIDGHRLNEPNAELQYNFAQGRFIRYVRVTPQQQRQLAKGLLGIAVNEMSPYDYSLIPRETAARIAALCPEKLLLLYPEGMGNGENEDGESGGK